MLSILKKQTILLLIKGNNANKVYRIIKINKFLSNLANQKKNKNFQKYNKIIINHKIFQPTINSLKLKSKIIYKQI